MTPKRDVVRTEEGETFESTFLITAMALCPHPTYPNSTAKILSEADRAHLTMAKVS